MRVDETNNKKESRIIISDGDSIIKTIDLDNYVFNSHRKYESNTVTISKTIKGYISEGYELISPASVGTLGSSASTFIFQKKQITDNTK